MKNSSKMTIAAAGLALLSTPVLAHHSYSMFDMNKTVAMNAEVVRFKWQNPHAFIDIKVATPNGSEQWAIEMTSPNNLVQEGWKRNSLKPGDRVTLYVHPLRSGARGGSYSGVRFADGKTLGTVN
ncbi:hypothetical protein GRI97_05035 [Altererythrobacter xixiisoli]|uniref:Uncharacterized protein n=1 Tax=Croceibacterium xixiisoli TaxID=1476466 RepID=A0A6I4TUV5_9SPHN|nr:DUF6152 family protein [Croceibacterium xixiisoli]MXO98348.1 hypothetical protein [Croceibacterium xixiisoli]